MTEHKEHRVIGPPGTGKTTYLARQAVRAASLVGPDKVMIASLTRAAAREVAGRDTPIPEERIGTLHAHAYRAMDRPKIADAGDGLAEWNRWVETNGLLPSWRCDGATDPDLDYSGAPTQRGGGNRIGDDVLQDIGALRARMVPEDLWPIGIGQFNHEWKRFKSATGRLDFTDLIDQAYLMQIHPKGDPKIIMLDEAQDLSKLELRLARRWGLAADQLVIVGDPDQCLYSWRGTDPDGMYTAEVQSHTVLEQSYRVPERVLDYALDWIRRTENRPDVTYLPRTVDPSDPDSAVAEGEVHRSGHIWRAPEGLVRAVERDLDEGKRVMVLATCGYMLEPLTAVLRHRGVPFFNPYRPKHGGWNPMRGSRRLKHFLAPHPDNPEHHMWTWGDVEVWAEGLRAKGILRHGAKAEIGKLAFGEGSMRKADVTKLMEMLLFEDHREHVFDLDYKWWHDNLLAEQKRISGYPVQMVQKRGVGVLYEAPRLIVGTIHSVKGGEADSVYVFPDLSREGYNNNWIKPPTRAATYRLFYVAFTRARDKLTLLAPSGGECVVFPKEVTA